MTLPFLLCIGLSYCARGEGRILSEIQSAVQKILRLRSTLFRCAQDDITVFCNKVQK